MADLDKTAERERKARAYRDLARSLASVSGMVYHPTASSIFDSLSVAQLNERHARSSQLSREVLFQEDPEASLPEELSDKAISEYLANAGDLYGATATDYVLMSDLPRAFKYFRKAAQHCGRAAALGAENGAKLLEKAEEYKEKTVIVRQELARRSIRRRKLSLGFLARLR